MVEVSARACSGSTIQLQGATFERMLVVKRVRKSGVVDAHQLPVVRNVVIVGIKPFIGFKAERIGWHGMGRRLPIERLTSEPVVLVNPRKRIAVIRHPQRTRVRMVALRILDIRNDRLFVIGQTVLVGIGRLVPGQVRSDANI